MSERCKSCGYDLIWSGSRNLCYACYRREVEEQVVITEGLPGPECKPLNQSTYSFTCNCCHRMVSQGVPTKQGICERCEKMGWMGMKDIPKGGKPVAVYRYCCLGCGEFIESNIPGLTYCVQCEIKGKKNQSKARTFATGATRNNDPSRVDWVRMLSFPVLRAYGDYMAKHRKQADGSLRDFDNWKKGIPRKEIIESLFRHVLDLVSIQEGGESRSNTELTKETCCAIMFNVMAYMDSVIRGLEE